jgi:hypothetical protein
MFASRYFAPRYFAPRYFPNGTNDAPVVPPADTHGGTATGWTRGLRFPREPEPDWVEQLRELQAIDEDETALLLILANL